VCGWFEMNRRMTPLRTAYLDNSGSARGPGRIYRRKMVPVPEMPIQNGTWQVGGLLRFDKLAVDAVVT
jgi:hypothetical protein